MVNFKSLALATTLAASALVAAPAVKAEIACGQLAGAGRWCGEYVGEYKGDSVFEITYTHYDGKEQMTVTCDGRNVVEWNSRGTFTQGQAQWIANEFCALPG